MNLIKTTECIKKLDSMGKLGFPWAFEAKETIIEMIGEIMLLYDLAFGERNVEETLIIGKSLIDSINKRFEGTKGADT